MSEPASVIPIQVDKPSHRAQLPDAAGAAVATALGLALGGPAGAVIGAAATPSAIAGVRVFTELARRRFNAIRRVVDEAATLSDADVGSFVETALEDRDLDRLLSRVIDAAAIASDEQLGVLAQALAEAVKVGPGPERNLIKQVVDSVAQLDTLHLHVLNTLTNHEELDDDPGLRPTEIGQSLGLDPILLRPTVRQLELFALIRDVDSTVSGVRWVLTPLGAKVLEALHNSSTHNVVPS